MKKVSFAVALLLLAGCSVTREATVSSMDAPGGIVRLEAGQAMLQDTRYDEYVTHGTATRACQSMGYSTAASYGEPVTTCTLFSGSLCMNEKITLQYKCSWSVVPASTPAAY